MAAKALRVLIVDNDRTVADSLAIALFRAHFEAVAAYSGAEAIKTLVRFKPDVLLTDAVMPGIHGVKVAKFFRTTSPKGRVLIMSSDESSLVLAGMMLPEVSDSHFLIKPVDALTILTLIAGGCRKSRPWAGFLG